jgi:hypothetical protein
MSTLGREIGRFRALELGLADDLARVAERHADEPDVFHLCRTFAEESRSHAARLEPLAARYGATSPPNGAGDDEGEMELLPDLMRLYVLAQECWIEAAALRQAALAKRDAELLDAVTACLDGTAGQAKWLKTRIKTTAPQALTVE